ncbi:hypothetical protein Franean1_6448 [Parafrankia sp. EAN1pec]|uniref:hypothetical protein n=1 Tax=Parafrankia sp. (strain EAN1pec) TaxID=298653 RepID=UPI0000542EE4|nr:hypothetical protein Franean1_6448 [Frankia sp. EAN1pec]
MVHRYREYLPRGETARLEGLALRVLPLGDSITYGVGTPDNSSYRARLWDLLDDDADDLDFVGSQDTGTLPDTDNEGHPRLDDQPDQLHRPLYGPHL